MSTLTQSIDTERIKQGVDLRTLAERYVSLDKASGDRELAGPCPKCGGDDRFHCTATWFFCRKCHPKRGDAIEFIQWLDGCGFREAVAKLDAGALPDRPTITPAQRTRPSQPADVTAKMADHALASVRVLSSKHGEPGRAYLLGRGIEPATWEAWGLGYVVGAGLPGTWDASTKTRSYPKQPAIAMPWQDEAGAVCGIRYRFLQWHDYTDAQGDERREKQGAMFGSLLAGLYGWPTHRRGARALVICEGELNALSVWQATRGLGVNVLSLGSESATIAPGDAQRITEGYRHVLVWLDRPEQAKRVMAALPGAHGTQSPQGHDANDWLQAGQLRALIVAMLKRAGWQQWYELLIAHAAELGITYERLDDGRIWLSRWDDALVREALALFRRIEAEAQP